MDAIIQRLAQELERPAHQVENVVHLIDEGNTIPFIARYRKELHGSMDDQLLRQLAERLQYLRNLEARKEEVRSAIEGQGKLNCRLKSALAAAETLAEVEDLYRPYKPKRRTRATIAREKGLAPLAEQLSARGGAPVVPEEAARAYVDPEKGVETIQDALQGASDILAEQISDDAVVRKKLRQQYLKRAMLVSKAADAEPKDSVYRLYYGFKCPVGKVQGYQTLAINRGEREGFLKVSVELDPESAHVTVRRAAVPGRACMDFVRAAADDAYDRLIQPSMEREIRSYLTDQADEGAIHMFALNLKPLLMQPPVKGKVTMGLDPGYRMGCKVAVVDGTGKVLDTVIIYPTAPQNKVAEAKETLKRLISRYHITLISLGNGTASRESEQVIVELLKEIPEPVQYVIVNEAGASVYSASKLATEEFPQFDVGQRSAVSIARRLQDPLAELVKIDPRSIGVGQYQHDMNQKYLSETLQGVVEDCVNKVGVDLNTASASLLEYVSGISRTTAKNIVAYREENGAFTDRRQLLKVPKLGPKAFEQCAGFLRISGGDNPLDGTSVHPESYRAAEALLNQLGFDLKELTRGGIPGLGRKAGNLKKLAEQLEIGEITLKDIVSELEKPGRDPRDEMPKPILRTDVLEMKDLKEGMVLKGTVRNVIDFGAFVDIGVHQDGLVHVSQMTERYIKHPLEAVSVGDIVEVKVLSVDLEKKRISLTMKL